MLRVTTRFIGPPGSPYWSTHYFGGGTQPEADAAAAAVRTFWAGLVSGLRTDMLATIEPEVEQVDPVGGNVVAVYQTDVPSVDMTSTGDPLPMSTQLLVRWRTGVFVEGKEIRGRTFIPGYTENSSTAGRPIATTISGVLTLAQGLITDAAAAGELVVYSPTYDQAAAVTATSVWTEWAVLRSRRD
jgi:hypothetical protein